MASATDMARYLWSLIKNAGLEQMLVRMSLQAFKGFVTAHFPWLDDEFFNQLERLYFHVRKITSS